jgi:LacI family transcriptional regulator
MAMQAARCTLKQLASIVGVAPSTVSRVLSGAFSKIAVTEETARRIREEADKRGYSPNANARRLLKRKAFVMGLEIPAWNIGYHSFSDATLIETLRGIEDAISGTEFKLMIFFKNESYMRNAENLRMLRNSTMDGLMVWGGSYLDNYHEALAKLPVVFVNTVPKMEAKVNCVVNDNFNVGRTLTDYAIAQGCRKFLYFGHKGTNSIDCARWEGFNAALEKDGASCVDVIDGEYRQDLAFAEMDRILSSSGVCFDCVICVNDNMALGVYEAARKHGLSIPQDFKLAAGDGLNPESAHLGITVSKVDFFKMGRLAMERLLALVEGKGGRAPLEIKIPHELIKRDTL